MGDVKQEIQQAIDKMTDLMKKKDYDALLDCYTEDCKVLPAGAEMIVGKEAMKAFMEIMKQFADKMGKVENKLLDVYAMGETATSVGTGTVFGLDDSVMDKTKSITIWKKVNGNWHIHCACWNHDKPMPMAPA